MLGNHRLIPVLAGHLAAPFDEHCKQVALAVRVMLFHELAKPCVHIRAAHIRRIRHHHIVLLRQHLRHADQRQDGVQGRFPIQADVVLHLVHAGVESGKVYRCHRQDGAVLLCVAQVVHDAVQRRSQLRVIVRKVVPRVSVNVVAFGNRIDMGLDAAGEDTPVILSRCHHHGKIGKLRRPFVNVQTVEVIFKDALRRVALAVPVVFVHLHQHIEGVHQDMAAAHARIDDLDVSDILVFALLLDFVELLAHFLGLRSFRQIILPAHPPGDFFFIGNALCLNLIPAHFVEAATVSINALFFPLVDEDAAKAVFHHIADDPVRREELGDGRDFLFGNLSIFGKGGVFRLGVVILVQPADNLHLTALFDVEIVLGNVMDEVIHDTFLIHNGEVQQQLGVVAGLLKQGGQDLVQSVALLDEQQPEQLVQLVLVFQAQDSLFLSRGEGQLRIEGRSHQIRFDFAALGGQDADVGGKIVVDLHETDGDQSVKPSVGDLFQNVLISCGVVAVLFFFADNLHQLFALGDGLAADGIRLRSSDVIELHRPGRLRQRVFDAVRRNPHQSGTVLDVRNELIPCPYCKVFYGCFVHGDSPYYIKPSMNTSAC